MNTSELRAIVQEAVEASDSIDSLSIALAARGVAAEWQPNLAGVAFRAQGATTAVKGSTLSRENLSARKIIFALNRNAELRRATREAAKLTPNAVPADAIDEQSLVAVVDDDEPAALATRTTDAPVTTPVDPLSFLDPTAPTVGIAAAGAEHVVTQTQNESERATAEQGEREQLEHELAKELAAADVRQLYFLRSLNNNVPEIVYTAAALERLVNLMLRILSLGAVRRESTIAAKLEARRELSSRADAEIQRRRRTPQGVAARKSALEQHQAAAREQQLAAAARQTANALAGEHALSPEMAARKHYADRFDVMRSREGRPTIAAARAEVRQAEVTYNLAGAAAPTGLLRRLKQAEHKRSMEAAEERRKRAAQQLQLLLDHFERVAAESIALLAAQLEQNEKREAEVLEALKIELGREFVQLRQQIDRDAELERLIPHRIQPVAPDADPAHEVHERPRG